MIAAADALRPEPSPSRVDAGLLEAWRTLGFGDPEPGTLSGQLLRPRFALAAAGAHRAEALGTQFWQAALAVQLAHEAALLHDDVVDGSTTRRGVPTLLGRHGVGAALVAGDQLLARAYLAAAATGSWTFVHTFTQAIDNTISGERDQGRAAGQRLDEEAMRAIARGKSGQLFGCAIATAAILEGSSETRALLRLGQDIGVLYQRVDDLLDYCPAAETGKPPLADLARDLWTWPRLLLEPGAGPESFFREGEKGTPAFRAIERLEEEAARLLDRIELDLPGADEVSATVEGWLGKARRAVMVEVGATRAPDAAHTRSAGDPAAVLARHGRSFHFASRLMPPEVRAPVARVYAFCRAVDDAVDHAPDRETARASLNRLLAEARTAYLDAGTDGRGEADDVALAMREMRAAGVPFHVVEKLGEGMEMDLTHAGYPDFPALGEYTHRVAGVVGFWIAGLAGCRDPWALEMADELGRAMQLTNIARDVGEDLAMGRLYLPLRLLERHRLDRGELDRIRRSSAPIPAHYAAAIEELMARADAGYGAAIQAVPELPPGYRRAVAVAARVYQGIHREIRLNGYDTLRLRARTGTSRKALLGLASLRELARAEARPRSVRGARAGEA